MKVIEYKDLDYQQLSMPIINMVYQTTLFRSKCLPLCTPDIENILPA
jgi:hypothetical protein